MKCKYKISAMKDTNILYNTIYLNSEEFLDFSLDCYESMLKGLSKEATLILSNTRELDRVPSTE